MTDDEGLESYTDLEISHLLDVKKVMRSVDYLFYASLLIPSLILTYYRKDKNFILKLLKYGGVSAVSTVLLILIIILFSFNFSFTIFHQMFFPQGNWMFPADSKLIETFPLEFFVEISRNIFLLALITGVFVFTVYKIFLDHRHNKS